MTVLDRPNEYAEPGELQNLGARPRRSLEQNSKFHAICQDFAKARLKWAGKPRDAHEWKVLLISGHAVATGQGSEVVAGLEGEFVNVRESSARMTKSRGSSLIEYATAMAVHLGVPLTETDAQADSCATT